VTEEILRRRLEYTVEETGRTYQIRGLGLEDTFAFARIIAIVQMHVAVDVDTFYTEELVRDADGNPEIGEDEQPTGRTEKVLNPVALLFTFAAGIPETEEEVCKWFGSILLDEDGERVGYDRVRDPDEFPIYTFPELLEQVVENREDLGRFFASSVRLAKSDKLREALRRSSGKSKGKRAGQMSRSRRSRSHDSSRSQTPSQSGPSDPPDKT